MSLGYKLNPFTGTLDMVNEMTAEFVFSQVYLGVDPPETAGNWRMKVVSGELLIEKYEGGVWVTKNVFF